MSRAQLAGSGHLGRIEQANHPRVRAKLGENVVEFERFFRRQPVGIGQDQLRPEHVGFGEQELIVRRHRDLSKGRHDELQSRRRPSLEASRADEVGEDCRRRCANRALRLAGEAPQGDITSEADSPAKSSRGAALDNRSRAD